MGALEAAENYRRIRQSIPGHVAIVVAAKTRTSEEVKAVIDAGAEIVGENYVQEADRKRQHLGAKTRRVQWHMIGRLQKNKINKALSVFDVIQSVDSVALARAIDKRAGRVVPVYIEVNIGGEASKSGIEPEGVTALARQICELPNLRLEGLMTMEPYFEDPERARPYFRRMNELFGELRQAKLPGAALSVLSMGMTNSYRVAIEEGANMIRIGTAIFGPRG